MGSEYKCCPTCHTYYPATVKYFFRDKTTLSGLCCYCKQCCKKRHAQYRDNDAYKRRKREYDKIRRQKIRPHLKEYYGMTLDRYNKMFAEQNGCCKICGVHQVELCKRLAVDHDHGTGEIRGLLCGSCNLALGHIEGAIKKDLMNSILKYLGEK